MWAAVLEDRKRRFGELAANMLVSLLHWTMAFDVFVCSNWAPVPVTFFVAVWLTKVVKDDWVKFVVKNTCSYFIYTVMDPLFHPNDLKKLQRISKDDHTFGIYMTLYLNAFEEIHAWYTGSATGYGSGYTPGGMIGRVLSYFGVKTPHFPQERWLQDKSFEPVFIRAAVATEESTMLHIVWWYALETFTCILFTLDTSSEEPGKFRAKGTGQWVADFRQRNQVTE